MRNNVSSFRSISSGCAAKHREAFGKEGCCGVEPGRYDVRSRAAFGIFEAEKKECEILTYYFQTLEREGLENEVLGHFRIFSRNLGPPWYTC